MKLVSLEDAPATETYRRAVADLIMLSLPEFYDILGRYIPDLCTVVAGRLSQQGGELRNCHVLQGERGMPQGVFCCYPSEALAMAQMTDLRAMLRNAAKDNKTKIQQELAESAGDMAAVPADGCYLSRFAVAPECRGQGAANDLIDGFKTFAPGTPLYLHVNRDNARAISFYRRHGFDFIPSDGDFQYPTMAFIPAKSAEADGTGQSRSSATH